MIIKAHVIFQTPATNFPTKVLPAPCSPAFWGEIVARNKNLLQSIIGFGRAILADTPPPPKLKGASFAPATKQSFK
jgi:hypothetical protein